MNKELMPRLGDLAQHFTNVCRAEAKNLEAEGEATAKEAILGMCIMSLATLAAAREMGAPVDALERMMGAAEALRK